MGLPSQIGRSKREVFRFLSAKVEDRFRGWKAKQGWRIVTHQASLLFKVFKGRYFRTTTFLNAKFGANPSFS
ncbi:hypothetical protein LIER_29233 [Lithospermum erythrorhizon]|uniref:Uncharacterized protein n=1 Tax=Lithospermum erythrorhizon TaxID=34254 RepID=A0AAV3RM06_LITER